MSTPSVGKKAREDALAANRERVYAKFPDRHERVVFARNAAISDPSRIVVSDDFIPWIYDADTGVWVSFDGEWSSNGPRQREELLKQIDEQFRQNEVWSRIRQVVLDRDSYSCVLCGKTKPSRLHVHHILKRKDGGTHHIDNLVTVCPSCHVHADRDLYDMEWDQSVNVDLSGVWK